MSAPILFIGLPLALAVAAYGLHRQRWRWLEAAVASGALGLLALLALRLPLAEPVRWLGGVVIDDSFVVLGRVFRVEPVDRLGMAFIYLQTALLCVGAALTEARRWPVPAGLAIVGLLAAALFIQPFVFAALFLELAAALAVGMLADQTHPVTQGAFRFLVFMTIGMAFILIAGWLLEALRASPDDQALILRATVILGVGFAVLMGVVPFHSWLPVVAEHSPPLSAAFVFTVMSFPAVFLLLNFLSTYPWLNQNPAVYRVLTLVGGGMVLAGALVVVGQRNFGRAAGYAMLIDIGAALLAIGLGTLPGVEAALGILALRGLALFLWSVGLDQLQRAAGGDDFERVRGLARRYPLATAAVVMGMLSLVGFPLLAGFPARWALLRLLAQIHPTAAIFLLIGMGSVALVCARGLAALLTPIGTQTSFEPAEPRAAWPVYGLGVVLLLALGAFPQWLLPGLARAAALLINPAP